MKAIFNVAGALALCVTVTACTVHKTEAPSLTGPSDFALSARMEANPDSIGQDGGSQSSIRVIANGPDGRPLAGVTFRVDMTVNGIAQDFGTLSARSIVTGSDGVARVIYTAPPADPTGNTGTCSNGLPGTCVTIIATPTSTTVGSVRTQSVTIRLVPLGVILPPADTPTPAFTFTPTPVNFNIPTTFDASTSCGGAVIGGRCSSTSAITSYVWDFGDGNTATGPVVSHTFRSGTQTQSTNFSVTLTVVNDRGISASATQSVPVGLSPLPIATFTYSPQSPVSVGTTVTFDASASQTTNVTIVRYQWKFECPNAGCTSVEIVTTTTTPTVTHTYTATGTFLVSLTIFDTDGRSSTTTRLISVQ